jgi:hypothetical protein
MTGHRLVILSVLFSFSVVVTETSGQNSVRGLAYISSDGMDSKCQIDPHESDHFQNILFLDDSVFVNIIHTCCGNDDENHHEDFAGDWFYIGKYKLLGQTLVLKYAKTCFALYSDLKNTSIKLPHLKKQPCDLTTQELSRLTCSSKNYFGIPSGEFKGLFVSPDSRTLKEYISDLKGQNVWQKLLSIK